MGCMRIAVGALEVTPRLGFGLPHLRIRGDGRGDAGGVEPAPQTVAPVATDIGRDQPFRRRQLRLLLPRFRRGMNLGRQRVLRRRPTRSGQVAPELLRPLLARFTPLQRLVHLGSETVVRRRPRVFPRLSRRLTLGHFLARLPGDRGGF
jgi:hypothetical protein